MGVAVVLAIEATLYLTAPMGVLGVVGTQPQVMAMLLAATQVAEVAEVTGELQAVLAVRAQVAVEVTI